MFKLHYQFKRTKELRFLSHLDQQRLFQRAFRRAGIPLAYSKGFNPHPKLSFALAMSVGLTSDCEFGEAILISEIAIKDFIKQMNEVLPLGLEILTAFEPKEGAASLSASLKEGHYEAEVQINGDYSPKDLEKIIVEFLDQPEINAQRKNKKGKLVEKNSRPYILSIEIDPEKTNSTSAFLEMILNYIDLQSVKPELVLKSIKKEEASVFLVDAKTQMHRKKLVLF